MNHMLETICKIHGATKPRVWLILFATASLVVGCNHFLDNSKGHHHITKRWMHYINHFNMLEARTSHREKNINLHMPCYYYLIWRESWVRWPQMNFNRPHAIPIFHFSGTIHYLYYIVNNIISIYAPGKICCCATSQYFNSAELPNCCRFNPSGIVIKNHLYYLI